MRIWGGERLKGEVSISGAKNLALPALAAGLLTEDDVILKNVPNLADVQSMGNLLSHIGTDISIAGSAYSMSTKDIRVFEAPYDFVRKMRASILVLGPLVGRFGKARVSLPGGCAIGARGVDLHIRSLEHLGANVSVDNGYINADAPNGLHGGDIIFPTVTVTGTENIMAAACFAKGTTRLINAAIEPEVVAFADLLSKMGANISDSGTPIITIEGVERLHGCEFTIIPDRIEAGTYAIAAAITGGDITIRGGEYDHISALLNFLRMADISVEVSQDGIRVSRDKDVPIKGVDVQTAPYPGLATDLQAQFMALMTLCQGSSSITENIFENRFMHVQELCRMGANITVHGKTAIITGVSKLTGANVMATDLRASVSLVLAGLAAGGETVVNRLYHLDRGYENLDQKLTNCGAIIERIII
jgi:UDP-N-acetylglucosamine 1-carboxyvinyltransferase